MPRDREAGGRTIPETEPARYHHGHLRDALIAHGLEMLETVGPAKLSLRSLARDSHVSPAAPYAHFSKKTDFLAALAVEGFDRLAARLEATAARSDLEDPRERLTAMAVDYVTFACDQPALFQLMFGSGHGIRPGGPDLIAAGNRAYRWLEITVSACLDEEGEAIRPSVMAAWSLVHGLAGLLIEQAMAGYETIQGAEREALIRQVAGELDIGRSRTR